MGDPTAVDVSDDEAVVEVATPVDGADGLPDDVRDGEINDEAQP